MTIRKQLERTLVQDEKRKDNITYVRLDDGIHSEVVQIQNELKLKDRSKVIRKFTEFAIGLYRGTAPKNPSLSKEAVNDFRQLLVKHKLSHLDVAEMMISIGKK